MLFRSYLFRHPILDCERLHDQCSNFKEEVRSGRKCDSCYQHSNTKHFPFSQCEQDAYIPKGRGNQDRFCSRLQGHLHARTSSASHQDRLPSTIHSTLPAPIITMQRQTRERRSSRRKNETSLATVADPQSSEHGTAMSKEESTPPLEPSPSIMQEPITVPYAVFIGER